MYIKRRFRPAAWRCVQRDRDGDGDKEGNGDGDDSNNGDDSNDGETKPIATTETTTELNKSITK